MIAVTLGDVAGVGPEVLARAWREPALHRICRPVVIGDVDVLARWSDGRFSVEPISDVADADPSPDRLCCLPGSEVSVVGLPIGQVHASAGRAAVDFLERAIELALRRQVEAIVTLPIHKAGLRAAGIDYPGHTEILAERTGAREHAMLLYRRGLAVVHVTLHRALRDVVCGLSTENVLQKTLLLDKVLRLLGESEPRIGVCALNPHAGDDGLFGDEEARIIGPAVEKAAARGVRATGPLPADTLFVRAAAGEFDGVVAMYHDQGHIALKLLGWKEAVNVTLGLPIIRTSVAHGTAYDIAGTGQADPASFFEAVRLAGRLCEARRDGHGR